MTVAENAEPDAVVYTDDADQGIPNSIKAEALLRIVNGMAHTNGIESFWSMLKRAHKGTFHKISPKHLDRYVQEFAGKHNIRDSGTLVQMRDTVARLVGRNLIYRDLIADNGLSKGSVRRNSALASFSGVAPKSTGDRALVSSFSSLVP